MRKVFTFLFAMGLFALVGCGENEKSSVSGMTEIKHSFMPENTLWEEDGFVDNGMTEETFNAIIASVTVYYKPIVKALGGNLVIHADFKDSTVNAYADQNDGNWNVSLFGGLARRPEVTSDGFAAVFMHELFHHLGGFPYVEDWASNEGNSDYVAFLAASKLVWGKDSNKDDPVDPAAKELCDQYSMDNSLCYRQMNAAYSLANLLGALGGKKISFKTPDKTIVRKTNNAHPNAQCRLDTYVGAILCNVAWDDSVIPQTESEMAKQSCVSKSNTDYDIRARSRCWFKPKI